MDKTQENSIAWRQEQSGAAPPAEKPKAPIKRKGAAKKK